jgi:LSD1 subclass zinc finger protein
MHLVVAKCNSCGAALRLDPGALHVVCEYCSQTLQVQHDGDVAAGVPRVTIAEPPQPLDEVRLTIWIGVILAVVALAGVVVAVTTARWAFFIVPALAAPLAILAAVGAPRKKAYLADIRLLREHGVPARATVRSISAGEGQVATLTLDLQVKGEQRSMTHVTSIPLLLVPRVTAGCALPVLVHPVDPSQIEIQWHLV